MSDILKQVAASLAAITAIVGAAWALGDNTGYRPILKKEFVGFVSKEFQLAMDQTEQNTLAIANQSFIRIEEKRDRGGQLTWEEKRDYCINAKILQFPVQGCLDNGQPNLITTAPSGVQK